MKATWATLAWQDGRRMLWIEGVQAASVATSDGQTTVSVHLTAEEAAQVVSALTADPSAPAWHAQALPSEDESRKAWDTIAEPYKPKCERCRDGGFVLPDCRERCTCDAEDRLTWRESAAGR